VRTLGNEAIPSGSIGQSNGIVLGFKAMPEAVEYDQQADVGHVDKSLG
jgi:hypothetical protein